MAAPSFGSFRTSASELLVEAPLWAGSLRYDAATATAYSDLGGESFATKGQTDFFLMKLNAALEPAPTPGAGSSNTYELAPAGDAGFLRLKAMP